MHAALPVLAVAIEACCIYLVALGDLRAQVPAFWAGFFPALLCYALATLGVLRRPHSRATWTILGAALVFRLTLWWSPPTLSDDIFRYVWDGRVQLAGITPYLPPPAATELAYLHDGLHGLVNHPDVPTIYPPLAQLFFRLVCALSATPAALKFALLLCDFGLCLLLWRSLVRRGQELAFWGPIYPGPQDVRYGYLLDGPGFGDQPIADQFEVVEALPAGTERLRALLPQDAGTLQGAGLEDALEPVMIEQTPYASYVGPAVPPGGEIRIVLPVQATSTDTGALRLTRADFWIDHDDTEVRVTAEVHLEVSGEARLAAPPGSSLVDLELPAGADFLGLNGSSELLGVGPSPSGGLAVSGPLSPGTSVVAYRYRLPVQGKAELLSLIHI